MQQSPTLNLRFQNYRSHFTVLRTARGSRAWIDEILAGATLGPACPPEWRAWVKARIYRALEAPRNLSIRSKQQQLPSVEDMWMARAVHRHFASDPVQFENFAAEMWVQSDPNVASIEVTRPSRDGGRDAIGDYRLGPQDDPVRREFALEAKCYDPDGGGVGVRLVSRLISRIKHRQFGVFVTTAFIAAQAYQEVREDEHPVVFLSGRDIVSILKRMGLATEQSLGDYLALNFPVEREGARARVELAELDSDSVTIVVDVPSGRSLGVEAGASASYSQPASSTSTSGL